MVWKKSPVVIAIYHTKVLNLQTYQILNLRITNIVFNVFSSSRLPTTWLAYIKYEFLTTTEKREKYRHQARN